MWTLLRLIILNTIALKACSERIQLYQMFPGDIININKSSLTSMDHLGSIFSSFRNGKPFISTDYYPDSTIITVRRKICLSYPALKSYFYPIVDIDGNKLNPAQVFAHLDEVNYDYLEKNYKEYLNENRFSFGTTQVCRSSKFQELEAPLLDVKYLPIANGRFVYKIQKIPFGVLQFGKGNQTHYLSLIQSGHCATQIFVTFKEECQDYDENTVDYTKLIAFFYNPLFSSRILTVDNRNVVVLDPAFLDDLNPAIELSLNNLPYSLSHYLDMDTSYVNVIRLKLNSLAKLPEPKKLVRSTKEELRLNPGDIIDHFDFRRIKMTRMDGGKSFKTISAPTTDFKYGNCREHDDTSNLSIGLLKNGTFRHGFNLFSRKVREKDYGVDPHYLTDDYKCYWIKICSRFQGPEQSYLPSAVKVVDLEKLLAGDQYNIFFNENVVMKIEQRAELFHVSRLEYGDCLFQALIYPSSATRYDVEHYKVNPMHAGYLISASDDENLENSVQQLIANYNYKIGNNLLNTKDNIINVTLPIMSMFTENVLINVDLDHLK